MFVFIAVWLMLFTPGFMLPLMFTLCNRRGRRMDMINGTQYSKQNRGQNIARRKSQSSIGEASQKHDLVDKKGRVSDFSQNSIGQLPSSSKREESTQSSCRLMPQSKESKTRQANKQSQRVVEPPGESDRHKIEAERRERRKQRALRQRENRQNYFRQIRNRSTENTLYEVKSQEMPEIDLVPQYYADKILKRSHNSTQQSSIKKSEEPITDDAVEEKESEYLSWNLKCATPATAQLPTWKAFIKVVNIPYNIVNKPLQSTSLCAAKCSSKTFIMSQAKPPNAARLHRIKVVGENFIQLLRKVKTPCELLAFSDIEPPTKMSEYFSLSMSDFKKMTFHELMDIGFPPEKARKLVKLLDVLNGKLLPPPQPRPFLPQKSSLHANKTILSQKKPTSFIKQ